MNGQIEDIRFLTRLAISQSKLRDAEARARRDMQRYARGHVACRITILSEYRKQREEEPEKGGAA